MSPNDAVLEALKQALDRDPRNGPLCIHYADLLAQAGRAADAISALRTALDLGAGETNVLPRLLPLLRQAGHLAEALIRVEKALAKADSAPLRLEFARVLRARGDEPGAQEQYGRARELDATVCDADLERPGSAAATPTPVVVDATADSSAKASAAPEPQRASVLPESPTDEELASQFDWEDLRLSFNDVAGLDEVKQQIFLRIIGPFKNREVYKAFKRQGGGGILLYGPPGCGKTFVARATAGECGARFVAVGIHELLDKYWGESERLIHTLFQEARAKAPTVLFFDEFDALGASRGHTESQFWRTFVDQLLQEMDGAQGKNEDVLVFAATNVPWNVDPAFRRPGRFDRQILVPPPDEKARAQILKTHGVKLPGGERIPLADLARRTQLFTGADLKSLCERSSERALGKSLQTGQVHPVEPADFDAELKRMQSSAMEWFSTARNYARYSNESGQYDELVEYLKRVKKW